METDSLSIEMLLRFMETRRRFIFRHWRFPETDWRFIETHGASPETDWRFIETERTEMTYRRGVSRNRQALSDKPPLPFYLSPEVNG